MRFPRSGETPGASTGIAPPGTGVGLAAAIDQAGQAVVVTDITGTILYVNAAFTAMTGYSSEETVGSNPRLLKSGKQDSWYYANLWESIKAGCNWQGTLTNRRKDGSVYAAEMTVAPVRDADGVVFRYIALSQDVTERRQSEQAQRFLAALAASSGDAIIGTTLDGLISTWNEGAELIYGYRAEEVVGKPISFVVPPDREAEWLRILDRVHAGQVVSDCETVRIAKDGHSIDVSLTVAPVQNCAGEITGTASIGHDVSEQRRLDRAMRDSAQRFQALFEHSRDCLFINDFQGNFLDANPSALNLLGYDIGELRRLNFLALLGPVQASRAVAALIALDNAADLEDTREYTVKCKDGTLVEIEVNSTIIPFESRTRAVLGVARNITARKRSEDALRESEERFRVIADCCPAPIWTTDAHGGVRFVNRTYREFFGVTYEQAEGDGWRTLLHPEDAPAFIAAFKEAIAGRGPFEREARVRRADNEWRWLATRSEPRWSPSGEFLGHAGLSPDITERKQTEEALRSSDEKFRQLAENIQEVFWMMNATGDQVLYLSPGYERIWGRSREAIYQNPRAWQEAIEPLDREGAKSRYLRQLQGERIGSEYRIRTPDGELKWILDRAFPVRDEAGEITRMVGVAEDITERKQAEEAMLKAKDAAQAANKAKSEFVANMSHEIRTPMNGVLGMSGLLLDTELTAKQRKYTEVLRASGESLLAVINDILDFSKIEAGKLELETRDLDLRAVLADATQLLGLRAEEKGLKLVFLLGAEVPAGLKGDAGRLRQVLLNLAGNSIKFTESGEVVIRVSLDSADERSAVVRFSIEDTGIGIPADRLDAIFSPFTQVDGTVTRKYGGTGLGLTICGKLVHLLGGRIGVQSELGKGSKFWFTAIFEKQPNHAGDVRLPVLEAHNGDLLRADAPLPRQRQARILLAEDNVVNQMVALGILEMLGHHADVVPDGKAAVTSLSSASYDLVLMDCQMPGMNGYEATTRIRDPLSTVLNHSIPIVALTAHAMKGEREKCLASGMDDHISKPVEAPALAAVIQKWLGREGGKPSRISETE